MATPITQPHALLTLTGARAQHVPIPPMGANAGAHQRKRVLVVDDDLEGALMLSLLLRELGYDVVTADNGSDALGWGDRLHPQVVLLDLAMPGMDGFELCHTLRQREWGEHAKVIAITGLDDVRARERSRAAGFDVHLVKPVDPQVLYRELLSAPPIQGAGSFTPGTSGAASSL